jgi:DNA end-binding protein Ku
LIDTLGALDRLERGAIALVLFGFALAEHILESKTAKFDATEFHDRYEEAIVAMLNEKNAGMPVPKQRELPRIVAGTDLMAALRQSIEKAKEAQPKAKPAPATQPVAAAKAAAAAKGKKEINARCCCQSPAARL